MRGALGCESGGNCPRFCRYLSALLQLYLIFDIALDVHIPSGQARGESRVLPFAPYGERKMPFRDYRHSRFVVQVQLYLQDLRRTESVGDEYGNFLVPFDDVYLFAVQFVDDVLNADAAQPDA